MAVDNKPLRDRSQRMDVHLDGVFTNEAALVAELGAPARRAGAYQERTEIDLTHGHMLVDVRLRPGQGVIVPPPQKMHHHAADGATPAPGSDPAVRGETEAGSGFGGRRADEVRAVGDRSGRGTRRVLLRPVLAFLAPASAAAAGCVGAAGRGAAQPHGAAIRADRGLRRRLAEAWRVRESSCNRLRRHCGSRWVMADETRRDVSTGMLTVVRLLQNPLGQEAPPGERGDMVRVSDGRARVYLLPSEFDSASPATLRWMLAQRSSGTRAPARTRHHRQAAFLEDVEQPPARAVGGDRIEQRRGSSRAGRRVG